MNAARQASLSITNSQSSLRLTSIESVMPSSHLSLCRPLLLPLIPRNIRVFSNTIRKRQFFGTQLSLWSNSHICTLLEKPSLWLMQTFVGKLMSLLFNTLSRSVIAFLPRRKYLLISWLQSLSAVILESRKIKSVTVSTLFPSICHEVMGLDAMILVFCTFSAIFFTLLFHPHAHTHTYTHSHTHNWITLLCTRN